MFTRITRSANALRPCSLTPNIAANATGSVLIEMGDTKVICAASFESKTPAWMKKQQLLHQGWVSAEYAMLPYATAERKMRECSANKRDTRSVEIQRLIGRSLRAVMDLTALEGYTLWIDCDVLQADGGTRTASISGAYVAAQFAIQRLLADGKLKRNPFTDSVAAISVGLSDGTALLDLDYEEDSNADVDFNVVMSGNGKLVEIQGTAERQTFSQDQLNALIQLAQSGIVQIQTLQQQVLDHYRTK